ncbi:hypothetical protein JXA63_04970 [Candidatus Woesebacteria bacterium]|nr:hypothetical protein [Candidatus Woesebacteria bacterium]
MNCKFEQLPKIIIIILATIVSTNMPEYINGDIDGYVPSDEVVRKNLRLDSSGLKQTSAFDIKNDVESSELGSDEFENEIIEAEDPEDVDFNNTSVRNDFENVDKGSASAVVNSSATESGGLVNASESPESSGSAFAGALDERTPTNTPTTLDFSDL